MPEVLGNHTDKRPQGLETVIEIVHAPKESIDPQNTYTIDTELPQRLKEKVSKTGSLALVDLKDEIEADISEPTDTEDPSKLYGQSVEKLEHIYQKHPHLKDEFTKGSGLSHELSFRVFLQIPVLAEILDSYGVSFVRNKVIVHETILKNQHSEEDLEVDFVKGESAITVTLIYTDEKKDTINGAVIHLMNSKHKPGLKRAISELFSDPPTDSLHFFVNGEGHKSIKYINEDGKAISEYEMKEEGKIEAKNTDGFLKRLGKSVYSFFQK